MTIPDKIRYQRVKLGLNQTELGERLGVKTNAVSKWETGKVSDIPASKIKKMAELFGVRPSYFIDEEEPEPEPKKPENQKVQQILELLPSASDEQLAQIVKYIRFTLQDE